MTARRPPRWHWWLIALVSVLLAAALVAHGYATHQVGRTGTTPPTAAEASGATARPTGAVLDLRGGAVASNATPERTVALTFDDGPHPTWTPAVLDVLARRGVPATFFVVGSRALEHPELLRRARDEGHEIGVHSFRHVETGRGPAWETTMQLAVTELAVAGATGISPSLYRPPYSSTLDALTAGDLSLYREAADRGYLIALSDIDSADWRRDGVAAILGRATPPDGAGGLILFHDGGGDRGQTVAALDRLIGDLLERGYRFTTVSEVAGLPEGAAAGPVARLQGRFITWTFQLGALVTALMHVALPALGVLVVARTAALVALARRHRRRVARVGPSAAGRPTVSIVVPAYNEAAGICRAVSSLVATRYGPVEIVVVDDGSTDATAAIVAGLGLPGVRVLTQPNRGKPAALNAGIAASRGEIVVMVDGDTVFQPDTVEELVAPFADPTVGAVAGNTKVANRRGLLGTWQHIEYVMGFNLDRRMYEQLRCMPTVPGAIGAFRRAALADVGGVPTDTVAEDTDLTMAIGRAGWHVVYEQRAKAWTEAPATLGQLWKQRYRWSYGTMQAMWKHREALRPSARSPIGRRALPYMFVFQILLPALAPVIDVFALYGLLFLDRGPVVGAWLAFTVVQVLVGWYAFRLDEEPAGPLWTLPLQQFVYRQFLYLVVIHAAVTALAGVPLGWHKLARRGDFSAVPVPVADEPERVGIGR